MQNRIWGLLAISFVFYACFVALQLGNVNLSQDQWHSIGNFLSDDFLRAISSRQNDHRTIFPNLIHYVNWRILKASQEPTMWLGFGFALLIAMLLVRLIRTEVELARDKQALLTALAVMTIFWMGNGLILFRANESLQSYFVLGPLIIALLAVFNLKEPNLPAHIVIGRMLLIAACGIIATFSFGAGVAVCPALLLMVLLNKSSRYLVVFIALLTATVCALYFYTYPHQQSLPFGFIFKSGFYLQVCRWLGAPLAAMLANNVLVHSYPALSLEWVPNKILIYLSSCLAAVGLLYLITTFLVTLSGRKKLSRLAFILLGMGIFSVGVAMLVELARAKIQFFFPNDIFSQRYFIWSSLFWFCITALSIVESDPKQGLKHSITAIVGIFFAMLMVINNPVWAGGVLQTTRSLYDLQALMISEGIESNYGIYNTLVRFSKTTPHGLIQTGQRMRELGIPVYAVNTLSLRDRLHSERRCESTMRVDVGEKIQNMATNNPSFLIQASSHSGDILEIVDQVGLHNGILVATVEYQGVFDILRNRHPLVNYSGVLINYREGESYFVRKLTHPEQSWQNEQCPVRIEMK